MPEQEIIITCPECHSTKQYVKYNCSTSGSESGTSSVNSAGYPEPESEDSSTDDSSDYEYFCFNCDHQYDIWDDVILHSNFYSLPSRQPSTPRRIKITSLNAPSETIKFLENNSKFRIKNKEIAYCSKCKTPFCISSKQKTKDRDGINCPNCNSYFIPNKQKSYA